MKNITKLLAIICLLSTSIFAQKEKPSDTFKGNFNAFNTLDEALTAKEFDSSRKHLFAVSDSSILLESVALKCKDTKYSTFLESLSEKDQATLTASYGSFDSTETLGFLECKASDGDKGAFIFQEIEGLSHEYIRVIELGRTEFFIKRI